MTPHIVSWGRNEDLERITPTGTASVVSFESLLSAPHTNQNSSIVPGASRARLTGPRSRPASFLGIESGGSETPTGSRWQNGDSFLHSPKYFFRDGNVLFLVGGFLYCVHRYFFSRDSVYFSTRFAQLGVRDHEALSTIVSLGDVECEDFEAFLSVLYPEDFEEHNLSYEQWRSVLHLSTRWDFASLRKLALTSIKPPTAYDRLLLARQYAVDHWVVPALTVLCERTAPLSLVEARGLGMEDVVLVATVREDIRSREIRSGVSPAEISLRVEAMQARTSIPTTSNEVLPATPTSEGTEQRPGTAMNATIGPDLEVRSRNDIETVVSEPAKDNTPTSGWKLGTPRTKAHGKNVDQEAKEKQTPKGASDDEWMWAALSKMKKNKGKSKAVADGLGSRATPGDAGSSAWTNSEPTIQEFHLVDEASEATRASPALQVGTSPPQPPFPYGLFGRGGPLGSIGSSS